jgi:hypothetical protein
MLMPFGVFPQQPNTVTKEDFIKKTNLLNELADSLQRSPFENVKDSSNQVYYTELRALLQKDNSFFLAFDSVSNLSVVTSPDKQLRFYTWTMPSVNKSSFGYFGFIQQMNPKTKKVTVIELREKKYSTTDSLQVKMKTDEWYGAIYYDLVVKKTAGRKYYTLLGWRGNNWVSTQKVIEVLWLDNNDEMVFGAPVFRYEGKKKSRIVFEYNAQATMSLRYHPKMKMIVFDHLSPPNPSLKGDYKHYGPDFTYDGLEFKKGIWLHVRNLAMENSPVKEKKPAEVIRNNRISRSMEK